MSDSEQSSTNESLFNLDDARRRAQQRRAGGVSEDFDPSRLALARRLAGLQRTKIARAVGVTPAAITQYEKGQARPSLSVVGSLAQVLDVDVDFFRAGHLVAPLPATAAHFRSLRSTSSLERERALAFAEVALAIWARVEDHVELPPVMLPGLEMATDLDQAEAARLALETRRAMGVPSGPIPHVVRLLEAHGVVVIELDDASRKVDAFSHQQGQRPIVLLSPLKEDKARSRFDAAHELGHLIMHHDTEPGSRIVEDQAHAFAAEFLTPADQILAELPSSLDWPQFQTLKRRWGVSLKALLVRAHKLGRLRDATYQRGLRQLMSWGLPERGELGPREAPIVFPRALEFLGGMDGVNLLARESGLPVQNVWEVARAGGVERVRPVIDLDAGRP